MNQTRFRTGVALLIAGGVVFAVATGLSSNALFAAAVALVGLGLAVHLTDPVIYRVPLAAAGLVVAIGAALADAVLTAGGHDGLATSATTVGIVAGVAVTAATRRLRR
ncbi:MAG: hypothetical protein QOJ07_494 [Thermoleophilaceae bacterium]|jgi:hypothetical protein|nr:hypothetical protein [Thermoleophilaceae bacterium]